MTSAKEPPKPKKGEYIYELPSFSLPLNMLREGVNVTFDNIWTQAEGQKAKESPLHEQEGKVKRFDENRIAALRHFVREAKIIDAQKLDEYNSAESTQDLLILLKRHGQNIEPEKRDLLIRKLVSSGMRLKLNKETNEIEGVYLSESARKKGLDVSSFESLKSELSETQFLSFSRDITELEARQREGIILGKVIKTEEGKAALLNNELTSEKVISIAEKIAKEDQEMQEDLNLLAKADKRIEKLDDEKAENDINKTRKDAPKKFRALEDIFSQNKKNEIEMTKALHRNHYSLDDCRTEKGGLYLKIEGLNLTPPKIDITLNGFKVQNENFSFDLDAAVKAVRGREEIVKWSVNNNLDKEKGEWFNYEDKFLKAAKLYKIAEEMPYILPGFNKLRLKDRFAILLSHIAALPTKEFIKFVDILKKIEDLTQIRENKPLKNMLLSMKFSEASSEAPAEGLS